MTERVTVLGGGEYPGSAPEVCSPKYLCLNRSNARFDKTPDTDFFFLSALRASLLCYFEKMNRYKFYRAGWKVFLEI